MAQAGKTPIMAEKMLLEEFGRCLLQIIHTANKTKGESSYYSVVHVVIVELKSRTHQVFPCATCVGQITLFAFRSFVFEKFTV